MTTILYRQAQSQDIPFLAKIRSDNLETEKHWNDRISAYLNCTHHPQQALNKRIIFVAVSNNIIVGFVAGHLTTRYDCEGELQWINVIEEYRNAGIASALVQVLAKWFIEQQAYKICVDPGNPLARLFYQKNGADNLNDHWMFWKDIRHVINSRT